MKNNEIPDDDFLKKILQKSSVESPSDDFIEKVMGRIANEPAFVPEVPARIPFFVTYKGVIGYVALAAFVLVILLTSDIPFLSFIPGKEYFRENFLPDFSSLLIPLKSLLGHTKALSMGAMILVSGGLLFLLDHLLSRKTAL